MSIQDDYDLDNNIGYLLRRAHQCGSAAYSDADPNGLSPIQFALLARLARSGPDSQNSLGRSVGSDAATTKGIVGRLERRNLVEMRPDLSDRRMKTIAITEEGRAVYLTSMLASKASAEALLSTFSAGERVLLIELLQRLVGSETEILAQAKEARQSLELTTELRAQADAPSWDKGPIADGGVAAV